MQIRVYYEDTDCGNVVYYANYLRYMERSRTEFMRERGIDLSEWHKRGVMFVVVDAHIKYRAPARYDDLLDVDSEIDELSSASITFKTRIYRHKGALLVQGVVRIACTGADGHVIRMPQEIQQILT
jgi:acyl-CoA thioester hydrolase